LARAGTERHGSFAGSSHFMAGLKGPILASDGGIRSESAKGSSLRFTPPSSSWFLMRLSGLCYSLLEIFSIYLPLHMKN